MTGHAPALSAGPPTTTSSCHPGAGRDVTASWATVALRSARASSRSLQPSSRTPSPDTRYTSTSARGAASLATPVGPVAAATGGVTQPIATQCRRSSGRTGKRSRRRITRRPEPISTARTSRRRPPPPRTRRIPGAPRCPWRRRSSTARGQHQPHEVDNMTSLDDRRSAADAELAIACDGWRQRLRCTDDDGRQRADPHPHCLAAQQRYVVALLECRLLPPQE